MQMKDTLSGDMNFIADLSLQGTTYEEQMQTLKGFVDFNIKDGTLGPFGKFENFLMAENIREKCIFLIYSRFYYHKSCNYRYCTL